MVTVRLQRQAGGRSVRMTVGRVTLSIMAGGRTDFARWFKRYSDNDFYGRGLWAGFSGPRLSVSFIVSGKQPKVIR